MATEAKKRVAIIGGGLSGLVSLKECLAEGFEVEAFEARAEIGGQWAYQPVPDDGSTELQSSMYDGVILNSCRDTTSFSDFPIDPARYGDFFGHRKMLRYIHEYADHFRLKKHVQLQTKVISCVQVEHGKWTVKLQREGREVEDRTYDAVFAAPGTSAIPSLPAFDGREAFRGEFFHSHFYRTPGRFEGKRVALIGIGSAAVDLACELSPGCREVHVIARRGGWIIPRYVLGKPAEAWDNRATQLWLPRSVSEYLQTMLLNIVQGELPKELKPEHTIMAQSPTIRSDFLERIRFGAVQAHRASVECFTEDGMRLSNGTALDVDVIIACTGYEHRIPYLPSDVLRTPETPPNTVDLWKLMLPARYDNLFIMGLVEITGPLAPTCEAQARLAVSAIAGRVKLPQGQQREKEIKQWQARHAKEFVNSERHAIAEHYAPYIDSLLAPLGAQPTMGKLFGQIFSSGSPWKAFKTLNAVYFGILSSAQWRLFGHGKNEKLARETVLRVADGKEELSKEELNCLM
ncbi:flavin-containing monooxygenase [Xylariaceae sp. FL0662B]|nr:flavin-containing monooxygenase [Xylariaceae sp. FL0662B]